MEIKVNLSNVTGVTGEEFSEELLEKIKEGCSVGDLSHPNDSKPFYGSLGGVSGENIDIPVNFAPVVEYDSEGNLNLVSVDVVR